VDSVKPHAGNRKVDMEIYVSSTKIERLRVYWDNRSQSKEINVSGAGVYPVTLDNLSANTYEFTVLAYDAFKHESQPVKVSASAFDDDFVASLWNRSITNASHDNGVVRVNWSAPVVNEVRSEIIFVNKQGETITQEVPITETLTILSNFGDWKAGFSYRSIVMPDPTALEPVAVTASHQIVTSINRTLDNFESLAGWTGGGFTLSLDSSDPTEGNYCFKLEGSDSYFLYQKVYSPSLDAQVTKADGYLVVDIYVENVSNLNPDGDDGGFFEISSSGECDKQELEWKFGHGQIVLVNGWNHIEMKLSTARVTGGDINLGAVNFVRIGKWSQSGYNVIKFDNLHFIPNK
jgi:hypothetical protein